MSAPKGKKQWKNLNTFALILIQFDISVISMLLRPSFDWY